MQHLVYLHGFLSSAQSEKAQLTLAFAKKHYPALNVHIPELPGDIGKAVKIVDGLLRTLPIHQVGLIGSSMGGYLASYALEKYSDNDNGAKAVLINPAVEPFALLADYLGMHTNPYTGEKFFVTHQHLSKLQQIYVANLARPKQYKVLVQSGDETLDFNLAANKYAQSNLLIEQGGNHSFVGYQTHLSDIFSFLYRN